MEDEFNIFPMSPVDINTDSKKILIEAQNIKYCGEPITQLSKHQLVNLIVFMMTGWMEVEMRLSERKRLPASQNLLLIDGL